VSDAARPPANADHDEAHIVALAKLTRTTPEVVRNLYAAEITQLESTATVKNYIGVIAGRRVKQRLMGALSKAH
jgi:uncharacterized protein DUF3562